MKAPDNRKMQAKLRRKAGDGKRPFFILARWTKSKVKPSSEGRKLKGVLELVLLLTMLHIQSNGQVVITKGRCATR